MLKRFNHVAIVVPDLDDASKKYKDVLNANVSKVYDYAEHGVSVVVVSISEITTKFYSANIYESIIIFLIPLILFLLLYLYLKKQFRLNII